MSTDRFQDEPRAAAMPEVLHAMQRTVSRRPLPSRLRRRFARGAGLSLVIALASGSALAVAGRWDPLAALHKEDPKSFVLTAPPARQTESLAVLRREQQPQDTSELIMTFVRKTSRGDGVNLRYVRFLRTVEGLGASGYDGRWHFNRTPASFVLLPRESVLSGIPRETAPKELRDHPVCAWTIQDSWPAGAAAPRLELPGQSRERPAKLIDRVTGGGSCASIQQIRVKGMMTGSFNSGSLIGIVPDGVATVRAKTKTGEVISSEVVNNSFELLAPGRGQQRSPNDRLGSSIPSGQFKHQSVEWLDASGTVIRHISR